MSVVVVWMILCDQCEIVDIEIDGGGKESALKKARDAGWVIGRRFEYKAQCPDCAADPDRNGS